MVYFGITIFLIILMMGGIGVDVMLAEMRRTQLQDTLDRAVLAASSLEQQLDPQSVVEDYFEKSDLAEHLKDIEVVEGLGYRTVRASADTTVATQFMHLSGVDSLTMNAESAAEERIGDVEISLILDVSGSMNNNNRLPNLKVAAKSFVDTLTATTEDGKLSISIVPYATQVSAPESLAQHLNLSSEHSYSNCVNFDSADFNTSSIDPTAPLERTMHFSPWSTYDGRRYDPKRTVQSPICEPATDNSREIVVLQKDATYMKNFIDSLWGGGNTSIDIGMKWGTALLNSSLQPVIQNMVDNGDVHTDFAARPNPTSSSQTLKVIVLMTDGQNTSQGYVEPEYRTGDSNIWWNDEAERYSVYIGEDTGDEDGDGNTTEPMFFWPYDRSWHDHAYGEGVYEETQQTWECRSYRRNGSCKRYRKVSTVVTVDEPGSAEILTYADLWAFTSVKENRNKHYYRWMDTSQAHQDWYEDVVSWVHGSAKDVRTRAICEAAKNDGIVVFSIPFEATTNGKAVLKDCASSISHYFPVTGTEIEDAFASIASSIRQLRLTQ
ncbi:Tad domain-containing protein [Cognatishimia sp. 1_MG-2023]|uniref:TadE/TadG family type IV pilus assembly protein n=1 Tax=Cognatishimia sp. 1_MG-2023 TaxID=3062642 RepID=UPI0026E1DAB3|nr:TadE/TadG family type IV pilus assembly protein [Cognatishimia sp. 1_MG-2023]MDO6725711.1 Tad domain-containing protein [Cognatishimia sp. 1_MG-2023]